MSAQLRRRHRRHLRYLALELLIVVLGVSISLLLNEWRQYRADRAEEQRMLGSFAADLRQNHTDLRLRIEQIEAANRLVQQVRSPAERALLDEEQRDRAMDALLGYLAFSPTRTTYLEMQQTGSSGLIRDKELLHALIGLYERGFPPVAEWDEINRSFVLQRMFPFIDEHGPAFASDVSGAFAQNYHKALDALLPDIHFRNLLRTSSMFKEGQRMVYTHVAERVQQILDRLEARLAQG